MKDSSRYIYDLLISFNIGSTTAQYLNLIVLILLLAIVVTITDYIINKVLIRTFTAYAKRSKSSFDDFMVENNVPKFLAHILPLIIAYEFIPHVFIDFSFLGGIALKITEIYAILLFLRIIRSILNTFKFFFKTVPGLKDKPVDSYIQVLMIFAWITGIVLSLAVLTGTPVWKFFTAMGAASAVILLIFKDSIMGFVASIQVSINDMVRIGDWITVKNYGADGDVIEINLATVKVRNFDNTITTIPPYALISGAFQNWRGMESSGGRRMKRAIHIKQDSIDFLSREAVVKLEKIELITNYLKKRQHDIDEDNNEKSVNKDFLLNGRNLTNFGVFRKYVESYLSTHSAVNKDMTIMVRHLAPTEHGIPLEIYAFSSDKRWKNYEYIMADIFDHIISSVPYFDLEIYEAEDSHKPN